MTDAPSPAAVPPALGGLSAIAARYDVVLCDVWGVVHNGIMAFPGAVDALVRMRARGARVVLITNAPRPASSIARQLDGLKVPHEAYDAIVSSGDLTRAALEARPGAQVFHIGPPRDIATFTGLDVVQVGQDAAEIAVCTGLFDDETETPADYTDRLAALKARAVPMLCANPDIVVARGNTLIYCAGAIAHAYEGMGGEVVYFGKPYPAIYDAALALAAAAGAGSVPRERVLAIGDALHTDMAGAARTGIDGLFIADGIHAEELGALDGAEPDSAALTRLFTGHAHPLGVMARLAW